MCFKCFILQSLHHDNKNYYRGSPSDVDDTKSEVSTDFECELDTEDESQPSEE